MGNHEGAAGGGLRLHHIAMRTANVEAMTQFYTTMLGLRVVRDHRPRSVWLGLSDGSLMMIEARGAAEPAVPAGSFELLAFRATSGDKAAVRERAMRASCFDGETEHTVYLRDPEGRRLGVSTYPLD